MQKYLNCNGLFYTFSFMELSEKGLKLIAEFEGLRLKAYLDVADVPTIGYGSTTYEDGTPVKMGDEITADRALQLFKNTVKRYVDCVNKRLTVFINQNQFDALVSICYNIGQGSFTRSSLLKRVNSNPHDPAIEGRFMVWNKARVNGVLKEVKGLTNRRRAESALYFSTEGI